MLAAIAGVVAALVALFALAPVIGGETSSTLPSTTTIVGTDPFDLELQSTSTSSTTTTLAPPTTESPAQIDARMEDARMEAAMFEWVTEFWAAMGDGDAVDHFIDRRAADLGLDDLVAFMASFAPHFVASDCVAIGANGVECTVIAHDPAVTSIAVTDSSMRLVVGLGSSGIEYVETPPVLSSVSLSLAGYARVNHTDAFVEACDPATLPDDPAPLRIGTLAAVPACGDYLAGLVREYLTSPTTDL